MQASPKVVLGIVLFGTKYLRESLPSVLALDYPNLEIFLIDQQEGVWDAFDFIHRELLTVVADPRVTLSKGKNVWHSGGHNVLIRAALQNGASYYLVGSNDMRYTPDLISHLVAALASDEGRNFGFAAPLTRRWDYARALESDLAGSETRIIDSAGLAISCGQHVVDRGQREVDCGQFTRGQVFGASGALVMIRRTALEAIGFQNEAGEMEYFDELIHYKNDVELSYRLNWAGQRCLFVPSAIAYHDRQLGGECGIVATLRARWATPRWAKESSFLGQHVVLYKNFSSGFSLRTKLATVLALAKRYAFALVFEPYVFGQIRQFIGLLPKLRARKAAMCRVATPAAIESLFR